MAFEGNGPLSVADSGNTSNETVTTLAVSVTPPPPAPVTNPPTTSPSTPSSGSTSTPAASSGGGGAINPWLVGSLALLFTLRRRHRTADSIVD